MRALTAGSAMIDTIAVIASDRIEQMTMSNADTSFLLLEEGRKTDALEISTHCGGGAVNAAVAMARLGHAVSSIVKLGRDHRAETMLRCLAKEGISCRWVARADELPTGASVLVSSHERDAAIFTYRGANTALVPADLDPAAFDVDLLYIASLSNRSADCFPVLIELARRSRAMVAANPGLRQLSAKGATLLDLLPSIDLLVMNRVEAEALIAPVVARFGESWADSSTCAPSRELPEQVRRPLSGGGFEVSIPAFLSTLVARGARSIAITAGRHGAFLRTRSELIFCPALPHLEPAGTAGAGDAFAATLAACLARGDAAKAAIRAATLNARSVVGHVDTQSGLLEAAELETALERSAAELSVRHWPSPA